MRFQKPCLILCGVLAAKAVAAQEAGGGEVERGAYLVSIMDCGGCHTRGVFLGRPDPELYLAGSEVGFRLPGLGYVYPPNLTPDHETGLGAWSEEEIVRAVREGETPDGRVLAPIMPWPAYSKLSDEDAYALAAYLKAMEPVAWADEPQFTPEGEAPPAPYLDVVMP